MANYFRYREFSQRDAGADPGGVGDNLAAWNTFVLSLPTTGVEVRIAPGAYYFSGPALIQRRMHIICDNPYSTYFVFANGVMGVMVTYPSGAGDGGGSIVRNLGIRSLNNAGVVVPIGERRPRWTPSSTVKVGEVYRPVKLSNFISNLNGGAPARPPADWGWAWKIESIGGNTTPGFSGTTGTTEPAWRNEYPKSNALYAIPQPSMAGINETGGGGTGTIVWKPVLPIGVEIARNCEFHSCAVIGFSGPGFNINAQSSNDATQPFPAYPAHSIASANIFLINRCESLDCGIGCITAGGDANIGNIIACNFTGHRGAGVDDAAWLGNNWIGNHIDQCGGSFRSSTGTFVGNYIEDNCPAIEMTGFSVWSGASQWVSGVSFNRTISAWHTPWTPALGEWMTIGDGFDYVCTQSGAVGASPPTGKPFIDTRHLYDGPDTYGEVTDGAAKWRAFAVSYLSKDVTLSGSRSFGRTFLNHGDTRHYCAPGGIAAGQLSPLSFGVTGKIGLDEVWDDTLKCLHRTESGSTSRRSISTTGAGATIAPVGNTVLVQGYYDSQGRFEGWATAAPTGGRTDGSNWVVGSHIRNSNPAVGQPKGWFCTVAGAPGTWVSEGNL